MAYVSQRPASNPIQLPPRPWQRRRCGMGQANSCGWFANWICSGGVATSVLGTPCNACPAGQVIPPPVLSPGSTATGLPVGYDPTTGLITGNDTGATAPANYQPVYPNNPGSGGAASVYTSCDFSQASWTDPTTWCFANYAIVGVGVLALLAFANGFGRGRR